MSELRPLAALSFGRAVTPAADYGECGRLEWIAVDRLCIDPSYQREILDYGKANIRRMIEEFSWALFGVLTVADRGGKRYAVIDGQHRATAAMMHGGIQKLPCLVLTGGVKQEARAFAAINGNVTRIHPLQRFRASVAAEEPAAVSLVQFCSRAGVTIAGYPKMVLGRGETMALNSIRSAVTKHGEGIAALALRLLVAAEVEGGIPSAAIQGAVALASSEPVLFRDVAQRGAYLRSRGGIAPLIARAVQRRATYGGPLWANFSAVVKDVLRDEKRNAGVSLDRRMAGR